MICPLKFIQALYTYQVTYSNIEGGYTGEGNINVDPLLVEPESGDYHLIGTSPCLNMATADGAPAIDLDGLPRPIGDGYDMGAYEGRIERHVYPGQSIQTAIDTVDDWYIVVIHPGTYYERIDFNGKRITVKSTDPNDPQIVASTILDGSQAGSVVKFQNAEGSSSLLSGLTIRNGSSALGGGISCLSASPGIQKCVITMNNSGSSGGGVYCEYSSPSLLQCTIAYNTASGFGGGMDCYHSSPKLSDCIIEENSSSFAAGGLFIYSYSSPVLMDCKISQNSAQYNGGILIMNYSELTATNCTITKNLSYLRSGGVDCLTYSSLFMTNCTLEGNSSSYNGGIYFDGTQNEGFITNCILWNNTPSEIMVVSGEITVKYSDIRGGYPGEGNINADPLFVQAGAGNYHLQSGSPCIDAGTNEAMPLTDLDGVVRPQDGDNDDEYVNDMGAYEFF